MTRQPIDVGNIANDGTGDPIRVALIKINAMTDELYSNIGNNRFVSDETELNSLEYGSQAGNVIAGQIIFRFDTQQTLRVESASAIEYDEETTNNVRYSILTGSSNVLVEKREYATGDGSATDFTLETNIPGINAVSVYVDNVYQYTDVFTVSGNSTVNFDSPPANGAVIEFRVAQNVAALDLSATTINTGNATIQTADGFRMQFVNDFSGLAELSIFQISIGDYVLDFSTNKLYQRVSDSFVNPDYDYTGTDGAKFNAVKTLNQDIQNVTTETALEDLEYGSGPGQVKEDQIVFVLDTLTSYTVLASDAASSELDYTGSGGVKLNVLGESGSIYSGTTPPANISPSTIWFNELENKHYIQDQNGNDVPLVLDGDNNFVIGNRIIGGIGASVTTGTLDWNDVTNARSGSGVTLLQGSATNGPGGSEYYHSFNFEEGTDKDGTNNITQLAIPRDFSQSPIRMRSRVSGVWTSWERTILSRDLGTAAAEDVGTAIGDIVQIEDDGSGNATIPAALIPSQGWVELPLVDTSITPAVSEFDITGLPPETKEIELWFDNISLDGNGDFLIQIGPGTTPQTTGYISGSGIVAGTANEDSVAGMVILAGDAARTYGGSMTFVKHPGTNVWQSRHIVFRLTSSNLGSGPAGTGRVDIGADIGCLRITSTSNNYDAGTVFVRYK